MSKKVILIIMDGWGLGKVKSADAIQNAKVPFVSSLYEKYPHTTLVTCGEDVGLPDGQKMWVMATIRPLAVSRRKRKGRLF